MTLKIDAKFEEKLIFGLENDMRNLANFHQSTWKSQNWYFDGIPLSKLESAWAWKLQRSYMSWQWRMMQNLKRNWLVILKIDMRNLMNFDSGTPLTKVYNVWAMFLLCLMALNIDAKFEGKLTCTFRNDTMNSANFRRLKNSNFILESKMAVLNKNKNSNQRDGLDAVWKLYFTLETAQ